MNFGPKLGYKVRPCLTHNKKDTKIFLPVGLGDIEVTIMNSDSVQQILYPLFLTFKITYKNEYLTHMYFCVSEVRREH